MPGPTSNGRPRRRSPARSQMRTLPSRRGAVERRAVAADREPGDLLRRGPRASRAAAACCDVPDDHAAVLAGRDRRAPVGAEVARTTAPRGARRRSRPRRSRGRRSAPSRRARPRASCDRRGSAPPCSRADGHAPQRPQRPRHRGSRSALRRTSSPARRPSRVTISVGGPGPRDTARRPSGRPLRASKRWIVVTAVRTGPRSSAKQRAPVRREAHGCRRSAIGSACAAWRARRCGRAASRTTGCLPPTASREPSGLNRTWSSLRTASMITPAGRRTLGRWRAGRRVRVSTKLSVPSLSTNASVRPSGLRSRLISRSPSPRMHADRRRALEQRGEQVAAVCSESSSATPWRASSSERSRSSSASAWAPRRCASAAVASSRALPRWSSATSAGDHGEHEQCGDAGEHDPQAALRALARAPALVEERALDGVELGLVVGRPVERRGQPRAAVQLAAIAAAGVPRRARRRAGGGAAGGPRRPPPASRAAAATRAAAPRARPRPRRR